MAVWRLMVHHKMDEHPTVQRDMLAWSCKEKRIAIGWGAVGDISQYASSQDIGQAIRDVYPTLNNSGQGGRCLWSFYHDLKKGDLVILATARRELVMEVDGGYEWQSGEQPYPVISYQHQRKAHVVSMDANELWREAGGQPGDGCSKRWTLIPVSLESTP